MKKINIKLMLFKRETANLKDFAHYLGAPRPPKGGDESANNFALNFIYNFLHDHDFEKIIFKFAGTLVSPFSGAGGSKVTGKTITSLFSRTSLIFFTLLLLNSCASEPQPSEQLFAHFNLRYLQPDNEIKSEAHFSIGSNLENAIPIKMDDGVSFQGDQMIGKEVSKNGLRYSLEHTGKFSTDYRFNFSTSEKKEIQYSLKMNSLDELDIDGEFVKSKGIQISWKGNPLSKNESLVFLFNNEKNNFVSFEMNGPTNTSSINIPSEKLNKLPEGKGEIYLVRKQSNTTEQSNVIILSETEFYSRVINVTILP